MNILTWVILVVAVLLSSAFNYILNRAPGADPEDFQVGPPQLGITCDCSLNVIIIGAIMVLALSSVSDLFATRLELYSVGIISFGAITAAGLIGRRRRHKEWAELRRTIERAVPASSFYGLGRAPIDIAFEDDDEVDDDDDDFDYGEF
ncbi:MAG: hypothetical protein EAX87_00225 [Candidatus Thorarchaeota archaeon]|nr:hypothetical protein [Candidatus Thorarchaeota archaeon]